MFLLINYPIIIAIIIVALLWIVFSTRRFKVTNLATGRSINVGAQSSKEAIRIARHQDPYTFPVGGSVIATKIK